MPSIHDEYESKHRAQINAALAAIELEYENVINRVIAQSVGYPPYGETFRITQYPSLNAMLSQAMEAFTSRIQIILLNSIDTEWILSRNKFVDTVSARYGILPKAIQDAVNNPNLKALEQFKARHVGGMKISDRVWRIGAQFRGELEQTMATAIKRGNSAITLAGDIIEYLKEPNRQSAAFLESIGKADLSHEARLYRPGQGIYSTSYQNAFRLARNEINGAYRRSDMTRWQGTPFVLGFKTRLSNRHPKYDICDPMAEMVFPTSFVWSGWHVQCLCSAIPVLAAKKEFMQYEDAIITGNEKSFEFSGKVTEVPKAFLDYVDANMEKYERWNRMPTFLADNPNVLSRV